MDACTGVHYLDTGMFDTAEYGAVYVVDAERPAVVDTGVGAHYERILDSLGEVGIAPEDLAVVALTHVHLDHAGGAGYLLDACPNAEVYVHEIGAPHLVDPERLVEGTKRAVLDEWAFYADPRPVPAERVTELTDGDAIDLGDRTLTAHYVPGHAPHQVAYRDDRDGALFPGDSAGIWVPSVGELHPTSPPPNFDLEQCLADVETLRALDPEVLLYPHFGPRADDPDGALVAYADVLDEWVTAVTEAAAEMDRDALVDHFADRNVERVGPVWGERKARAEASLNVRGVLHSIGQ